MTSEEPIWWNTFLSTLSSSTVGYQVNDLNREDIRADVSKLPFLDKYKADLLAYAYGIYKQTPNVTITMRDVEKMLRESNMEETEIERRLSVEREKLENSKRVLFKKITAELQSKERTVIFRYLRLFDAKDQI